jgi:hypothetical protein
MLSILEAELGLRQYFRAQSVDRLPHREECRLPAVNSGSSIHPICPGSAAVVQSWTTPLRAGQFSSLEQALSAFIRLLLTIGIRKNLRKNGSEFSL